MNVRTEDLQLLAFVNAVTFNHLQLVDLQLLRQLRQRHGDGEIAFWRTVTLISAGWADVAVIGRDLEIDVIAGVER